MHVPDAATHDDLNHMLTRLQQHKRNWAGLPLLAKRDLLLAMRRRLKDCAAEWVRASVNAKCLPPDSPWVGEEWITGPWAIAATLQELADSLGRLHHKRRPNFNRVYQRANGQVVIDVFPHKFPLGLLFHGRKATVWMEPHVTPSNLDAHIGRFYQDAEPSGKVTLILGAGNINSIPVMDALFTLFNRGEVVLLKLNPVNGYLRPLLNRIFAPLIQQGYMVVVEGDGQMGAYLTRHPDVDTVHITGSAATHDTIVFGSGPAASARKANNQPVLSKPITSELGGVCPVIVLPGPWTDADFRFHAENVVSMRFHNGGFNCVAAQVLVLPAAWDGTPRLLDAIRDVLRELPPREPFYPGAVDRQQQAIAASARVEDFGPNANRVLITEVDPTDTGHLCFTEEIFGPVLVHTNLPGQGPTAFLQQAVWFANEVLAGTLGASIIAHPRTLAALGDSLEQALEALRFGAVAVNAWAGETYLVTQCPWGAARGHTLNNIQSGIGVVHNTFLLEDTQKVVLHGAFRPFPRSVVNGEFALSPKPPWFVTNRRAAIIGRDVAMHAITDNHLLVLPLMINSLRG